MFTTLTIDWTVVPWDYKLPATTGEDDDKGLEIVQPSRLLEPP